MTTAAAEPAPAGSSTTGTDQPDNGTAKLFEVPKVKIDTTQPTLLTLAFSGGILIGFDEPTWVEFYNKLASGKPAQISVTVHVAGTKTRHRRDKEGDVDAVVQTKILIVTDVHLADEDE